MEEGLRCVREFSTSIRSSFQKIGFSRRDLRPKRSVEKLSNKCATFCKTPTQVTIWKVPRRLRNLIHTAGAVLAYFGGLKSVTWKIPSVLARRTSSVCRMTPQSSPPRPHYCGTSMIDGQESFGGAMAKGLSIAITRERSSPIPMNSHVSMRSRCHRHGRRCGFVPILIATSKPPAATRAAANNIATMRGGDTVRDDSKFEHMLMFGRSLPAIRQQVDLDLLRPACPREKVLAAVVRLMEHTLARIGNLEYARQNQSFGLTTLQIITFGLKAGRLNSIFGPRAASAITA